MLMWVTNEVLVGFAQIFRVLPSGRGFNFPWNPSVSFPPSLSNFGINKKKINTSFVFCYKKTKMMRYVLSGWLLVDY